MFHMQWQPHPEAGYFGVVGEHIDGGNSTITYGYNRKWEVVSKQSQVVIMAVRRNYTY